MEYLDVFLASLLIFFARIFDVSLGTMRIIFVAKGRKYLAPALGFVEIMIWLSALSLVMRASQNIAFFIAYAGGFALGNYAGIMIENKIALGKNLVRIITKMDATDLIQELSSKNFGVTTISAKGKGGDVSILYTIVNRKDLKRIVPIIFKHNPMAFYSIEEVQAVNAGIFPTRTPRPRRKLFGRHKRPVKGK